MAMKRQAMSLFKKSNNNEALSDDSFLKSNTDEALNTE
jgi:hypothetical protein